MLAKKPKPKHKAITRKDAREAFRTAKKTSGRRRTVATKAWKKGGAEYSKVLGHFGITMTHSK